MNQHVPPPADELPSIIPAQGVNVAAAQVAGRSCARSDRAPLAVPFRLWPRATASPTRQRSGRLSTLARRIRLTRLSTPSAKQMPHATIGHNGRYATSAA